MSAGDLIQKSPLFKKSRLYSLYSDFSDLKQLNIEGYEANIHAWSQILLELIRSQTISYSRLFLRTRSPDLSSLLSLPIYGPPSGLKCILTELVERNVLIELTQYKNSKSSYSSKSNHKTGVSNYISPYKWIEWGMSKMSLMNNSMKLYDRNGDLNNIQLLYWDALVEDATILEKALMSTKYSANCSDLLFDLHSFRLFTENALNDQITDSDLYIYSLYLSRDCSPPILTVDDSNRYFKLRSNESSEEKITEEDITVIELKAALHSSEDRFERTDKEIAAIDKNLKEILCAKEFDKNESLKVRAKYLLRKKRALLKSQGDLGSLVDSLRTMIDKINNSLSLKNNMRVMESSNHALRSILDSFDISHVEKLKVNIESNLDDMEHLSESMYFSVSNGNESDIEEDLQQLEKEVIAETRNVRSDDKGENIDNPASEMSELIDKLSKTNIKNDTPITDDLSEVEEIRRTALTET